MQGLRQDLRYAVRMLVKQRAFSIVTVLTLGLGIGANTTVFSVANAVLFRPLPVRDGERVLSVFTSHVGGRTYDATSYPDYLDLRERTTAFSGLAAHAFWPMSLRDSAGSQVVMGQMVSWNFFEVLGVMPAHGRAFRPEEDQTEASNPVAIISDRIWERIYDRDEGVLGRTIRLNDRPFTVVGVAPPGFTGLSSIMIPDVFVPTVMVNQAFPYHVKLRGREDPWLTLVGRLKPGTSPAQARDELTRIAAGLVEAHPDSNRGKGFAAIEASQTRLIPNETTGGAEQLTALLLTVVLLVLLIACFNVASMHLARAAERRREIALRVSLGATRWRVIRQLLTESCLLALLAGGAGLLTATWAVDLLAAQELSSEFPLEVRWGLDSRVLGFTLLLALGTGLSFGVVPALQALRLGQYRALRDQEPSTGPSRSGSLIQRMLVVGQLAVSVVLLIGAGLFLQSLGNALEVHPGFALRDGLIAGVNLGYGDYSEEEGRSAFERLGAGVRALPGVESASFVASLPLGESHGHHDVEIAGYQPAPDEQMLFKRNMIDEHYLETMGTRVTRGRGFDRRDDAEAQPVAIVNETMARRYWPDGDAVGGVLRADHGVARVVVGVVEDGKYRSLGEEPQPYVCIPLAQADYVQRRFLVVRTAGDAASLRPALEQELRRLVPELPVTVSTVRQLLDRSVGPTRGPAMLLAAFGLLALTLAVVGVFGIVSYMVSRRTHEFGVRMALGARGREIVGLVLRSTALTALAALGLGLAFSVVSARLVAGFLFGVDPLEPGVFVIVSAVLLVTALGAALIPARWAGRIDPVQALRFE